MHFMLVNHPSWLSHFFTCGHKLFDLQFHYLECCFFFNFPNNGQLSKFVFQGPHVSIGWCPFISWNPIISINFFSKSNLQQDDVYLFLFCLFYACLKSSGTVNRCTYPDWNRHFVVGIRGWWFTAQSLEEVDNHGESLMKNLIPSP